MSNFTLSIFLPQENTYTYYTHIMYLSKKGQNPSVSSILTAFNCKQANHLPDSFAQGLAPQC